MMGSVGAVFGQTITIDPCEDHAMSSHIIGVCRNHVQDQTVPLPPPGNNTQDFLFAEKLALYSGIMPSSGNKLYRFGGSMVDGVPGAPFGLTGWSYPISSGQTGSYPYDDFQFYLNEATDMNADLLIGVNVGTGTPEQAAELVTDLINSGDINRVALFEMGNELSGFWQAGHQCGPQEYINTVTPIINAMVDAADNAGYTNELPIGLMGSYGQAWAWTTYGCPAGTPNPLWEETINTYIAAHNNGLNFNFICFHGYTFGDLAGLNTEEVGNILQCTNGQMTDERAVQSLMALNHWAINNRITQIQTMLQGTGIQLAETEYATHISQDVRPNITHSIVQALFAADNMMTAIKRDIPIANNYAFFMESSTTTDNTFNLMFEPSLQPTDVLTPKPVFFAHRMIAENLGQVVLRDDDDGTMFGQLSVLGCANGQNYNYPRLSYVSTMDTETNNNIADGTISTLVINRSFGNTAATIQVNFNMPEYTAQIMSMVGSLITDESPQFTGNNPDGPEFIDVTNMNNVSFEPLSISIIRFTPKEPLELEFAYKDLGCFNIEFEIPQNNPTSYSYFWDFGDGVSGTEPKHTYSDAGTYMVTLTIQTAPNCTVTHSQEIVVSPTPPINKDYTYTINADCSVSFTGPTGNPSNTTYSWDFGDGSNSTAQNPSHTYTDNGSYSVVLTVTDACGNSVSETHSVGIDCAEPPACTPCTGTYAYNIDAGTGLKWSQTGLFDLLFQSCLTISGRLIIDENVSIIGGEIRMGPGAEIVISSGASLELAAVNQNGGIHGCEVMWRGITVDGGGSLFTGDDGTFKGTIISDAQYAVKAMNNSTIDIRDVNFIDNYVGVDVAGLFINQIGFIRNKFSGTGNMLAPFENQYPIPSNLPKAGIRLRYVDYFSIGIESSQSNRNEFYNMHNAIIGGDVGSFVSYSSKIESMIENAPNTDDGYGIKIYGRSYTGVFQNEISNVRFGIKTRSSGSIEFLGNSISGATHSIWASGHWFDIKVKDNHLENCINGLVLFNCDSYFGDFSIANNHIAKATNGMWLYHVNPSKYNVSDFSPLIINNQLDTCAIGILFSTVKKTGVEDNNITFDPSNTVGRNGIQTWNSEDNVFYNNSIYQTGFSNLGRCFHINNSYGNSFCCNSTANTPIGFGFRLMDDDTKVRNNTIGNHSAGLYLDGIIGPQENASNLWTTNTPYSSQAVLKLGHAVNLGDDDERLASQFTVTTCEPTTGLWPTVIFPDQTCSSSAQDWFYLINGSPKTCETDENCIPPSEGFRRKEPKLTGNDRRAIAGKFLNSALGHGLHWEKTKQLYRKLLEYPSLLGQQDDVDDFFAENNSGVVGALVDVSIGIEQLNNNLHSTSVIAVREQIDELERNRLELAKLDQTLLTDTLAGSVMGVPLLEHLELVSTISSLSASVSVILEDLSNERALKLEELISANAQIPANNQIVQYEKFINDVYLRKIASGNMELSTVETSMLYDIANSCALDLGGVVYRARAIYRLVSDTTFYDEDLCDLLIKDVGAGTNENSFKSNTEKRFLILPNPTNSFVNLSWPIDMESVKDVRVEVLKPMGDLVKVVEFSGSLGQKTFELPMQPGIYTVNFYLDGQFVENQTLIIIE